MNIEDERRGKWAVLLSNCPSRHMTLYRFHQIKIELLIGELYNQVRCDRHSRQLYGSVAGNSGDVFFATCFRKFMIFCAKFYFSAQMATMAIGNANPASVGLKIRRLGVRPLPGRQSILLWRLIIKYFLRSLTLPSTDSRRAVVSFWRKDVFNIG